jgi:hypothetical protein
MTVIYIKNMNSSCMILHGLLQFLAFFSVTLALYNTIRGARCKSLQYVDY